MATKKTTEIPHAIIADAYDKMQVAEVINSSQRIKDLCVDEASEGFTGDTFNSLYKMEPKVAEDGPEIQSQLVKELMDLREYSDLRGITQLNDIGSAISTVELAPRFLQELKRRQEVKKEEQKTGKPVDDSKSQQKFRIGMRQACKQAADKAEKADDAMNLLAGDNPGQLERLPAQERMSLARKVMENPTFQKIAQLIGRFKNIVNAAVETSPTHGCDEITDITTGTDLQRLLPSEMLKLAAAPTVFLKDYSEGKLLNYALRGEEKRAAGPIIAAVDVSGSMRSGEPSRECWSKAVAIALSLLAQKQKRGFGIVFFDTRVTFKKAWMPGETITMEDRLEIASHFTGGGTTYFEPLKACFDLRKEQPSLKPADIVFITDGYASLSPDQLAELLKLKAETGVRMQLVELAERSDPVDVKVFQGLITSACRVTSTGDIENVQDIIKTSASMAK